MTLTGDETSRISLALYTICIKSEVVLEFMSSIYSAYRRKLEAIQREGGNSPYREKEVENISYLMEQLEYFSRRIQELHRITCSGGPAAPYQAKSILDQIYYKAIIARQKLPTHLTAKLYDLYLSARELL